MEETHKDQVQFLALHCETPGSTSCSWCYLYSGSRAAQLLCFLAPLLPTCRNVFSLSVSIQDRKELSRAGKPETCSCVSAPCTVWRDPWGLLSLC